MVNHFNYHEVSERIKIRQRINGKSLWKNILWDNAKRNNFKKIKVTRIFEAGRVIREEREI